MSLNNNLSRFIQRLKIYNTPSMETSISNFILRILYNEPSVKEISLYSKYDTNFLFSNYIEPEEGKAIAKALNSNSYLKHIDISKYNLSFGAAKAITDTIKTNDRVTSFNLSESFEFEYMELYAEAFQVNTTVEKLNISKNSIGDEFTNSFAKNY